MDSSPITIFNRRLYRSRRECSALGFAAVDAIKREACAHLADRLDDIDRHFPLALDLGCHGGQMAAATTPGKVGQWVHADFAEHFVRQCTAPRLVTDEEFLPFADHSFDLVVCALSLHMVNDLAGCFIQIRRILKPDGLFLAVMPGSRTLIELRESFATAQDALTGGVSPMVAPFIEVRDGGALLQRAGFALPVADTEMLQLRYSSPLALMRELRAMGESNCLTDRLTHVPRAVFAAAAAHYQMHHADPESPACVRASLELITLTGWSPHASQQQPAKRGSGTIALGDALH